VRVRSLFRFLCAASLLLAPSTTIAGDRSQKADRVVVNKSSREMTLWSEGEVLRTYKVALGGNPVGHKREEGDQRTPEGSYTIDYRNPESRFHLSLHISYPNEADRKAAQERGVSPGGDIFIHGLGSVFGYLKALHTQHDWTDGCIAVTNQEIEEIWELVSNGTPIRINP